MQTYGNNLFLVAASKLVAHQDVSELGLCVELLWADLAALGAVAESVVVDARVKLVNRATGVDDACLARGRIRLGRANENR